MFEGSVELETSVAKFFSWAKKVLDDAEEALELEELCDQPFFYKNGDDAHERIEDVLDAMSLSDIRDQATKDRASRLLDRAVKHIRCWNRYRRII